MIFPLGEEWCGIYLHVPFCVSKCHYCDFLSHPQRPVEEMERYVETLLWEAETRLPRITDEFSRFTVYLGGGTPTSLPPKLLERILSRVPTLLPHVEEITVEANPHGLNEGLLSMLEERGVTRLSLGVQSLDPRVLKTLGRGSGSGEITEALELSRGRRFSLSVDLIYGAPYQTCQTVAEDIKRVIAFSPHHISAYSLTLEGEVPLKKAVEKGVHPMPDDEEWQRQFFTVRELLEKAGYVHYETSNFARGESYCLHNLIYWSNGSYLGLGLGAVSHLGGRRWGNPRCMGEYLARKIEPAWEESLPHPQKAAETAILLLRTRWGIHRRDPIVQNSGIRKRLERLTQQGLLSFKDESWRIPAHLQPVANEVLSLLLEGSD